MANEARPICGNAVLALKKNSTKLLVTMCIGIGLAMYGIYVQSRTQSNPSYAPTISVATNWLHGYIGNGLINTGMLGCNGKSGAMKASAPNFMVRSFVNPIVRYSGWINGFIHIIQIILLKIFCRSIKGTDGIIALSAIGLLTSVICLGGAFASCKMMCISCLGVQHIFIIYFAIRRRAVIQNIHCPQNFSASSGSCTMGNSGGMIFGNRNSSFNANGIQKAADSLKRRALKS